MGVGPPYNGGCFPTCMSMRTRGTSTRTPPPPPASPRHASSRRVAGCGNEPSRCLNFCHALRVYERSLGSRCTLRFVSLVLFSSQCSLSPPSLAPIKGRSLLLERRTRISSSSRHKFLSTALLLRSSSSRLAACTTSWDSRPLKPHLFESCTGGFLGSAPRDY